MPRDLTFNEVLDAVLITEDTPSIETLNRWVVRFPQYRKSLARFFVTWALQSVQPAETPPIDSQALASQGVIFAQNLLDSKSNGGASAVHNH